MDKMTYYINVSTKEISRVGNASPIEFEISATEEEVKMLREVFDQMYSEDWQGFFRAHVPYVQYHDDPQNDDYDNSLTNVYALIHDLGTDETKKHIESMGVLNK